MGSPQSVVSPFRGSSAFVEPEKQKSDPFTRSPSCLSSGVEVQSKEATSEDIIGTIEVYIHQARDIHNICIYQKQDVYAKICLTSDPANTVSTQIINGGGRNPVFNEKLQLNVRTIESSVKCEIWMLSRVRNYLEDQLLGFALVPLSEVLIKDGKLEKEFSLSSTDLFHSPAGFVQLSLAYTGASPEVMSLPSLPAAKDTVQDSEVTESEPSELDKIEFPDPKIITENNLMVSEYFGLSQTSESFVSSDTENQTSSEIGAQVVESFSAGTVESAQLLKPDSPPSSVSTNGLQTASHPDQSSESRDLSEAAKSPNQGPISPQKENPRERREDVGDAESEPSGSITASKPLVSVNIEPEQKVVQQDIVDMYMKSMQQFTESLARMKLPMDIESGPPSSESSSSDQKLQASKNTGSRVFYGSRAFF